MQIATVTGAVWATRKAEGLRGPALLTVKTESAPLVAADLVGAGAGDRVLLAFGAAARMEYADAPFDAAIVAILDKEEPYVTS